MCELLRHSLAGGGPENSAKTGFPPALEWRGFGGARGARTFAAGFPPGLEWGVLLRGEGVRQSAPGFPPAREWRGQIGVGDAVLLGMGSRLRGNGLNRLSQW